MTEEEEAIEREIAREDALERRAEYDWIDQREEPMEMPMHDKNLWQLPSEAFLYRCSIIAAAFDSERGAMMLLMDTQPPQWLAYHEPADIRALKARLALNATKIEDPEAGNEPEFAPAPTEG